MTTQPTIPEETRALKKRLFDESFQWLSKTVPRPISRKWVVLEAGQGRYGWSDLYHDHFDRVYGADIEDYSAYHPGVTSIKTDFCDHIPLPEQSIDLIVSHSVLEHVGDVAAALRNFDRVLKTGGFVFITISPLYYSAEGSHIRRPVKYENWEHLDPTNPAYLCNDPCPDAVTDGHGLNKMTLSDFLAAIGRQPWSIMQLKVKIDPRPLPDHLTQLRWRENDLRTKGFFLLAHKEWHCQDFCELNSTSQMENNPPPVQPYTSAS